MARERRSRRNVAQRFIAPDQFKEFARIFGHRFGAIAALRSGAFRAPDGLASLFNKKRILGSILFASLLALFLVFNRFPKLDLVQEDLVAATSETARCFQGFCLDNDPDESFLVGWWTFSLTYMRLVAIGMIFAVLVAGITESFLFPRVTRAGISKRGLKGALTGLVIGTPMTLCSACIVPVSSAFRRRGAGIEASLGMLQGSSTLNLPALIMVAIVFTPLLSGSRIALGIAGGLLVGPLVALSLGRRPGRMIEAGIGLELSVRDDVTWRQALSDGFRDWATASAGHAVRLGPLMVAAAFVTGLVLQWVNPEVAPSMLGNNIQGVAVAATIGILINVPLMFEIPLVAALLLAGMGAGPAATLLFTAAAAGPFTFWGFAKVMPKREVAALGAATWGIGVVGGLGILLLSALVPGPVLAGLESRSEEVTSGESRGAPSGPVVFTDVTEDAGLMYRQFNFRPAGECLLDLGPDGYLPRQFCLPERMSGGAAAADYDNDGYVDLFVTRLDGPDLLFRNTGMGRFEDRTADAGLDLYNLRSNGAVWVDVDNDRDMDLYVTTIADTRFYLFINDGAGNFVEEAIVRGAAIATSEVHIGYSVAVGDYDLDGWPDLHVTEWGSSSLLAEGALSHARLLRNRGLEAPGQFEDVTVQAGVVMDDVESRVVGGPGGEGVGSSGPWTGPSPRGAFSFSSAFTDLDDDGWPDLAVASDFGTTRLYWNNGDGTFTDGTVSAQIGSDKNGMGSTFGDFDGDGDLDWFVSSTFHEFERCQASGGCDPWGATGNRLYRNEGQRVFSAATVDGGVRDAGWGAGSVFFDFDNDGDLDLTMVNGMRESELPSDADLGYARLWRNDGSGAMTEISGDAGLTDLDAGKGLLTFDYDGDGDLDLFIVNNGSTSRLYRNDGGNANSWLQIEVVGDRANSSGIGTKLKVGTQNGVASQIREIGVRSHFLGQSELTEHFGLGPGVDRVEEITVVWPTTGEVTVLRDVPANVTIIVREGQPGYQVK